MSVGAMKNVNRDIMLCELLACTVACFAQANLRAHVYLVGVSAVEVLNELLDPEYVASERANLCAGRRID